MNVITDLNGAKISSDLIQMSNKHDQTLTQTEMISYSTTEQWTGKYWIDGHKIYQKSYNLGTINAFEKIENIANFDRNIRYEFSMKANDKVSGVNSDLSTDLFVTSSGDVCINTNGNTRYEVVLTLWYTKTTD